MHEIFHALVLNMHQSPSRLDDLLDADDWEAKEILLAYDRMPRSLWPYEEIARVHLSMSGTLLETLSHPAFQRRVEGIAEPGTLLWSLQNTKIFDILGTGYYHPILALTPEADWDEQIGRWQRMARHVFWRERFGGFWPPELGFDMRLIPHLKKAGYRWVVVDGDYLEPVDRMSREELLWRPHLCEYEGERIVIVPRDRALSEAQLSGMEYDWFAEEIVRRTRACEFAPLVVTATDGDGAGWFRDANFWTCFYHRAMEEIRAGNSPLRPTFVDTYLDRFGAEGRVKVESGAWSTPTHPGRDFGQWRGGDLQRAALARAHEVSALYHHASERAFGKGDPELWRMLFEAYWRLLRAQTSSNFQGGDGCLWKTHKDLDDAAWLLGEAAPLLGP